MYRTIQYTRFAVFLSFASNIQPEIQAGILAHDFSCTYLYQTRRTCHIQLRDSSGLSPDSPDKTKIFTEFYYVLFSIAWSLFPVNCGIPWDMNRCESDNACCKSFLSALVQAKPFPEYSSYIHMNSHIGSFLFYISHF